MLLSDLRRQINPVMMCQVSQSARVDAGEAGCNWSKQPPYSSLVGGDDTQPQCLDLGSNLSRHQAHQLADDDGASRCFGPARNFSCCSCPSVRALFAQFALCPPPSAYYQSFVISLLKTSFILLIFQSHRVISRCVGTIPSKILPLQL